MTAPVIRTITNQSFTIGDKVHYHNYMIDFQSDISNIFTPDANAMALWMNGLSAEFQGYLTTANTAKDAALAASNNAESAKNSAESAKSQAISSAVAAEADAITASGAANAAAASAADADLSSQSAAASALAAGNSANAAAASFDAAAVSAESASDAATSAEASKDAAAGSATTAANSVSEINDLATQINGTATDITTKHSDVVIKHDAVMTTAQQMQINSTALQNAVNSASGSATNAASSASNAAASKDAAAQSAVNAANSANAIYDAASHPNIYIFKTAGGQPSFFYAFPRCTWIDLMPDGSLGSSTHQAFLEDGVQRDVLYIAMYPLSLKNGEVVSQPNSVPHTGMTLDEEKAICAATQLVGYTSKHRMMSIWDWSLVTHWCLANGIQPIGNTNYGKPHEAGMGHIRGVAPTGGYALTGTMGAKSSHNQTLFGVFDLVGNVWTRLDKMLLQDGRIRLYADNGVAGFVDQNYWINSSVAAGYGTPSISTTSSITTKAAGYYDYVAFSGLAGGTTLLQQATLAPLNGRPANGGMWVINTGTRAPLRGGYWGSTSDAGLGAFSLNDAPSDRYSSVGFRSAFVM